MALDGETAGGGGSDRARCGVGAGGGARGGRLGGALGVNCGSPVVPVPGATGGVCTCGAGFGAAGASGAADSTGLDAGCVTRARSVRAAASVRAAISALRYSP